eukprot:12205202-Alexandrium_andersonii.AAC.1
MWQTLSGAVVAAGQQCFSASESKLANFRSAQSRALLGRLHQARRQLVAAAAANIVQQWKAVAVVLRMRRDVATQRRQERELYRLCLVGQLES